MNTYMSATLNASFVVGILGGVFWGVGVAIFDFGLTFYFGLLGALLYCLVGFLLSGITLLILIPIFKRTNSGLSCIIFLGVGFFIALSLAHLLNFILAHGANPYSDGISLRGVIAMTVTGIIGMAGSLRAWFVLYNREKQNGG